MEITAHDVHDRAETFVNPNNIDCLFEALSVAPCFKKLDDTNGHHPRKLFNVKDYLEFVDADSKLRAEVVNDFINIMKPKTETYKTILSLCLLREKSTPEKMQDFSELMLSNPKGFRDMVKSNEAPDNFDIKIMWDVYKFIFNNRTSPKTCQDVFDDPLLFRIGDSSSSFQVYCQMRNINIVVLDNFDDSNDIIFKSEPVSKLYKVIFRVGDFFMAGCLTTLQAYRTSEAVYRDNQASFVQKLKDLTNNNTRTNLFTCLQNSTVFGFEAGSFVRREIAKKHAFSRQVYDSILLDQVDKQELVRLFLNVADSSSFGDLLTADAMKNIEGSYVKVDNIDEIYDKLMSLDQPIINRYVMLLFAIASRVNVMLMIEGDEHIRFLEGYFEPRYVFIYETQDGSFYGNIEKNSQSPRPQKKFKGHHPGGDMNMFLRSSGTLSDLLKLTKPSQRKALKEISKTHNFEIQRGSTCAACCILNALELLGSPIKERESFFASTSKLRDIEDIFEFVQKSNPAVTFEVFEWGPGWLKSIKEIISNQRGQVIMIKYENHQLCVVAETKDRKGVICLNSYGRKSGYGGFEIYSYDDIFAQCKYYTTVGLVIATHDLNV